MQILRSYFIAGKFLGSSDETELGGRGDHYFWFCLTCGDVYARAPVISRTRWSQMWKARWGCCEKCQSPSFIENWVPGSIWPIEAEQRRINFLPKEVVQRELLLTIKQAEKELQNADKRTETKA